MSADQILLAEGPMLSSELARRIMANGASADAARQRISRAGARIGALKGLVFPRGVRFLFHKSQEFGEAYWRALARDIQEASPAYSAALSALQARSGVVPLDQFLAMCGSPVRQTGQISAGVVLERLEAVKLVERIEAHGVGTVVALSADGSLGFPDFPRLRARLVVEKMMLLALRDWARRLGVASYDKVAIRGDDGPTPMFGTFQWDLCGPSYLVPIMRRERDGKPKPGFLVADVVAGEALGEGAVGAFVRKYQLSRYLKNLSPFLPILLADGYTPEAFRIGRTHGLMLATPKNLFGRDVAIGLASLLETLSKAAAIAVTKPEVIGQLFDKLGSIEGADLNLRGALFELVVGHVVQARSGGSIDINHLIRGDGFEAEVDVRRVVAGEVWIYECKGYQPDHMIGIDDIEKWLTDRVPGIFRATKLEPRFSGSEVHFEFWTSGGFTPEAEARLAKAKAATRKYGIGWKSGKEVRAEIAKMASSGMAAMFDEHFMKHPIAVFDRRHDGTAALAGLGLEIELPPDIGDAPDTSMPAEPSPAAPVPALDFVLGLPAPGGAGASNGRGAGAVQPSGGVSSAGLAIVDVGRPRAPDPQA